MPLARLVAPFLTGSASLEVLHRAAEDQDGALCLAAKSIAMGPSDGHGLGTFGQGKGQG
jgi:hypothetical protein